MAYSRQVFSICRNHKGVACDISASPHQVLRLPAIGPLLGGTPTRSHCWPDMPRFLFQSPDQETGGTIETDWLELADLDAACRAAEEAVREAALEFEGLGVVTVIVYDDSRTVVHRAEIEIRTQPCGPIN